MTRELMGALTVAVVMMGGCSDRNAARSAGHAELAGPPQGQPDVGFVDGATAARGVAGPVPAPALATAKQPEGQTDRTIPEARKLIRNAEMTIEVMSVSDALARLREIMASVDGQSTSQGEHQNQFGGRTASVTWRVPAERLDTAIDAARTLGDAKSLSFTTEDVTTHYFDVSVRINTQQQLERRLVGLLQRPSNRLSDLLEIEREAARVREEIDQLQGRIRRWDSQIAMSSLQITLQEPAPLVAGTGGPLATLMGSFGEAAENLVLTVAGLIAVGGSVLPVAVLLVFGWLTVRLWRRRRAAAAPAA
jgi:Domain of unknown function (DUF4349)